MNVYYAACRFFFISFPAAQKSCTRLFTVLDRIERHPMRRRENAPSAHRTTSIRPWSMAGDVTAPGDSRTCDSVRSRTACATRTCRFCPGAGSVASSTPNPPLTSTNLRLLAEVADADDSAVAQAGLLDHRRIDDRPAGAGIS